MKLITKTIIVPDNMATGEQMRIARKSAKITLRELAGRLGQTAPYISDLELGRRNWSQERIDQWMTAFKK